MQELKRKEVHTKLISLSAWTLMEIFDGQEAHISLKKLKDLVENKMQENAGRAADRCYFDIGTCSDGYNTGVEYLTLYAQREETDEEAKNRTHQEKVQADRLESLQRLEFERLKMKFEGNHND